MGHVEHDLAELERREAALDAQEAHVAQTDAELRVEFLSALRNGYSVRAAKWPPTQDNPSCVYLPVMEAVGNLAGSPAEIPLMEAVLAASTPEATWEAAQKWRDWFACEHARMNADVLAMVEDEE